MWSDQVSTLKKSLSFCAWGTASPVGRSLFSESTNLSEIMAAVWRNGRRTRVATLCPLAGTLAMPRNIVHPQSCRCSPFGFFPHPARVKRDYSQTVTRLGGSDRFAEEIAAKKKMWRGVPPPPHNANSDGPEFGE